MSESKKDKTTIDAFTYLKIRQIERDLERGYFGELDFFLKYSKKNGINYALEWAAFHGKLEYVKMALTKGADIHANNDIALQMAVENNHLNVVKYLIIVEKIFTIEEQITSIEKRLQAIEEKIDPVTK